MPELIHQQRYRNEAFASAAADGYTIRRAKKGALVIAPEKQHKDIFDLPLNELKKLVQGFIWRDEHFSGMTLRDIAKREEFSEGYVGQCIFQTFEIPLA